MAGPRLEFPWPHLVLTPFSTLADLLTCNSLRQDIVFLVWCLALYAAARSLARGPRSWRREARSAAAALGCLGLFLAWAVFWPRSAARLAFKAPGQIALDFHSHTSHSWDGLSWFSPARNVRWHERAGYDGAFFTDHGNTRARGTAGGLDGEEVGVARAHILLLGNRAEAQSDGYAPDRSGLEAFLRDASRRWGGLAVMSLPEYWRHHWEYRSRLPDWGARGFEIVSASPKALDFPAHLRSEIVELCRLKNLFMTGGSDNHGYAQAACVWSLMEMRQWASLDAGRWTDAVINALSEKGFSAVTVAVRTRTEPALGSLILLDTPIALWTLLRTYTAPQSIALLAWLWLGALLARHRS